MEGRSRISARLLAVSALGSFVFLLLVVVVLSFSGSDGPDSEPGLSAQPAVESGTGTGRGAGLGEASGPTRATGGQSGGGGKLPENIYVVKPGDSLSTIAGRTGIPVDRLRALNPNLDPQALISGQRVKLRE